MPYEIKDRLELKLYFDGVEFPFEQINALDFLQMSCSTRTHFPMLHMRVFDQANFFGQANKGNFHRLADGTLITVVLKIPGGPTSKYEFRVNSFLRVKNTPHTAYEIDGYLDVPAFLGKSYVEPIRGTSAAAIEKIANLSGFRSVSTVNTADSQVWYPNNRQMHDWAANVAKYGYRSDGSLMVVAVDLNGELRYLDAADLKTKRHDAIFADLKSNAITLLDIQPSTASGVQNMLSGYKDTRVQQSILQRQEFSNVKATKVNSSGTLLVNSKVRTSVDRSIYQFSPIDLGNNHENYERALYQNRRLGFLYNSSLETFTQFNTEVRLLDRMEIQNPPSDTPDGMQKMFFGTYIVASRTIYIHANNHYEKFELVRNTQNASAKDAP